MATTFLIVIGATIGTAAHGAHGSVNGLLWCLTFGRGITGVVSIWAFLRTLILNFFQGVGGEYPASSTSASEAANEKMVKQRGPGMYSRSIPHTKNLLGSGVVFIMVTNFVLSVSSIEHIKRRERRTIIYFSLVARSLSQFS